MASVTTRATTSATPAAIQPSVRRRRMGGIIMCRPMARRGLIIAIDGPSGAGKGTVARALAARLRYRYIDSGAMYRAVAWKARQLGVDLDDGPQLAAVAEQIQIDLTSGVHVDGADV